MKFASLQISYWPGSFFVFRVFGPFQNENELCSWQETLNPILATRLEMREEGARVAIEEYILKNADAGVVDAMQLVKNATLSGRKAKPRRSLLRRIQGRWRFMYSWIRLLCAFRDIPLHKQFIIILKNFLVPHSTHYPAYVRLQLQTDAVGAFKELYQEGPYGPFNSKPEFSLWRKKIDAALAADKRGYWVSFSETEIMSPEQGRKFLLNSLDDLQRHQLQYRKLWGEISQTFPELKGP